MKKTFGAARNVYGKKGKKDVWAVSEALGTILMLSITTFLVGTVAIWATTLPGPDQEVYVDLNSDISFDDAGGVLANQRDTYFITHEGGKVLGKNDVTIHVKYAPAATPEAYTHLMLSPYTIEDSADVVGIGVGTNGFWEPGETWSIQTPLNTRYSQTGTVKLQVIYAGQHEELMIMESTFDEGSGGNLMPDLAITDISLDSATGEYLIDDQPVIQIDIENFGDDLGVGNNPHVNDVIVNLFDDERQMGTATLVTVDADNRITPGEVWTFELDTTVAGGSSDDWNADNRWDYTGRHTLAVKVIPLDEEKQYANNYENEMINILLDVSWRVEGPDPAVDSSWVRVSNTNPRNGEAVSITITVKNRGDAAIPIPADETESVWLVISSEPITRRPTTELYDWTADSDDADTTFDESEFTCVVKDITVGPSSQESYTFTWMANAAYPGETRSIYFAVDVDHTDGASAGTVEQSISHFTGGGMPFHGDDPSNNQAIIDLQVMPKVLVVDNDGVEKGNPDDITSTILEGLIGAGISVDGLIRATDTSPPYASDGMEPYDIIIWVGGRNDKPLSASNELAISQALDDNKYVWLVGNHFLSDFDAGAVADSPNLLKNSAGSAGSFAVGEFPNKYLGIQQYYTGVDAITGQYFDVQDPTDLNSPPLADWMTGDTTYPVDYISDSLFSGTSAKAYWNLDDGSGTTVKDISPNLLHGTRNGPIWTSGKYNSALRFDGVNDNVYRGSGFTTTFRHSDDFTISAWVKPSSLADPAAFVGQQYGTSMVFGHRNDGSLFLNMDDTRSSTYASDSSFQIQTDVWQHVTVVYDGTNHDVLYYLDGVADSAGWQSNIDSDGSSSSSNYVYLGWQNRGDTQGDCSYYEGLMDDVRVYDKMLNTAEIRSLMNPPTGSTGVADRTMEIINSIRGEAANEEISEVIQAISSNGVDRYNSIAAQRTNGYKCILTSFDYASMATLNEEINIATTVLNFFNWRMDIGEDLAITGFSITPSNPNFMQTVELSVIVRNNGQFAAPNQVMFYITGEDGIEKIMPTYLGDNNPIDINPPGRGQQTVTIKWLATETGRHTFRAMVDPYNILQEVSETNNDLSYSGVDTSSMVRQSILVVDDEGDSSTKHITNALTAMGYYFSVWDTTAQGIPLVDDMKFYNTVIWNTGSTGGTINNNPVQVQIRDYLEGNYLEAGYLENHNETFMLFGDHGYSDFGVGSFFYNNLGIDIRTGSLDSGTGPANPAPLIGVDGEEISHGADYEVRVNSVTNGFTPAPLADPDYVRSVYSMIASSGGFPAKYNVGTAHMNVEDYYNTLSFGFSPAILTSRPTGSNDKENALSELLYMGLHWLSLKESRPDFRCTESDISIDNDNPQLGNAYVITADIQNIGDGDGSCSVRFLDGNTLIRTSTIFIKGGETVTEECIWVPLYAGSGTTADFRSIRVELDMLDNVEEVFEDFNNRPRINSPVFFFFDDMTYTDANEANGAWNHESTVVKINGESTLEYMDNAKTGIVSDFNDLTLDDANNKWIHNTFVDHSMPSSYSIKEPTSTGDINSQLDIVLLLDRSGSMNPSWGGAWYDLVTACEVLIDSLDGNDRVAIFTFDSYCNAQHQFEVCDDTGKTTLKNFINAMSLPQGGTNIYNGIIRDTGTLGVWNGDWDGEASGDNDDGALWYLQENYRATAIPNLITMSDGASSYSLYDEARNAIWTAAGYGGTTNYIDNWYPTGTIAHATNGRVNDIGLYSYSIALGISHDPAVGNTNPIQARPSSSYRYERMMWQIAQESMTGGDLAVSAQFPSGTYTAGDYSGYGYYYTTDPTTLSDIFQQISESMGSAGSTRSAPSEVAGTRGTRSVFFSDDFERATLGTDWSTTSSTLSGINSDTAQSPTRSLYTKAGSVYVTLDPQDLSNVLSANVSYWARKGADSFSEDPDGSENFITQYKNNVGSWITLKTHSAGDPDGQIYTEEFELPADALHSTFQFRVRQTSGSGSDFDYWHFDDFQINVDYIGFPIPADKAANVNIHPTLMWVVTEGIDVDHFEIHLGTETNPGVIEDPDKGGAYTFKGAQFDPGKLLPLTTYYWKIKVVTTTGTTLYSPEWTFTTEIEDSEQAGGDPAHEGANRLDTKSFTLTGTDSARLEFYHKFNIAGTINGAFLELGVYDGPVAMTEAQLENVNNYDWYYIQPEEPYNSNLYLGSATTINRPLLGPAGSNYQLSSPDDPTRVIWCWNGKSNNGLFEWEYVSVDLIKQADMITASSSDTIDLAAQPLKLGFTYFYFGGGIGGGWWIDDIKVTSFSETPVTGSTDVWQWRDDGDGAPGSPGGYWWNGEPGAAGARTNRLVGGIDNSLVTRPIDLTRAVQVDFDAKMAFNVNSQVGMPPDGMRIEISDDGGQTWMPINYGVRSFFGVSGGGAPANPFYVAADTLPRINADLSAWAGRVVILRFRVVTTNDGGYTGGHNENNGLSWGGIFIDDVMISGTSISDSRSQDFDLGISEVRLFTEEKDQKEDVDITRALLSVNSLIKDEKERLPNTIKMIVPMGMGLVGLEVFEKTNGIISGEDIEQDPVEEYLKLLTATKIEMDDRKGSF